VIRHRQEQGMTYLAISTNLGDPSPFVAAEGARTAELVRSGVVEHVWLKSDWSGAVMVLSSATEDEARAAMDSLPISQAGLTRWALTPVVAPPVGPPPAPQG
jgi:hypothetical protein